MVEGKGADRVARRQVARTPLPTTVGAFGLRETIELEPCKTVVLSKTSRPRFGADRDIRHIEGRVRY
ncbi:hypothetical protein NL676_002567 [Syzygium grande]|nr:hypothetical protein NL676_002567 [Syzygium grande]